MEETEEKCSESGKLFNVGFKLDDSFFKVFEICYDNEKSTVLYTKHIINGKGIRCKLRALENVENTPFYPTFFQTISKKVNEGRFQQPASQKV